MLNKLAKTPEQEVEVDKLKKQYHEFYTLCDAFNSEFSSRGWIAYESMNAPTMRKALKLSKAKWIGQANDYLIEYYDRGAHIDHLIPKLPDQSFRAKLTTAGRPRLISFPTDN